MRELIVDNFAGGGGTSTGAEFALGRPVNYAINHDKDAIAMHKMNHPLTKHYCEDIYEVDPRKVANGRPVALVWLSPACTHYSKARGKTPLDKKIRGLAWIAMWWAGTVKPRVIILENVEEFKTWGRLTKDGYPDPRYKGETFRSFVHQLRQHGYEVEWKELKACDYGVPTIRKRFFMIARCDGRPIVFPQATHGAGLKPYKTAAECIDSSIPMQSIFDRKKPLAEATMRRIARGIKKFVLDNTKPFIMQMNYDNAPQDIEKPLTTITSAGHHYLVSASFLDQRYGGEQRSGADITKPMPTITTADHNQLTALFLSKYYGGNQTHGSDMNEPLPTITAIDHNSLVSASFISHQYGTSTGQELDKPLHTITQVSKASLVSAFMQKYCNSKEQGSHGYVITINGIEYVIVDIQMRMLTPKELFAAQGFPPDYIIDRDFEGKPYPKSKQIARCGNSVCPPVAEALIRANFPELAYKRKLNTMAELREVCRRAQ